MKLFGERGQRGLREALLLLLLPAWPPAAAGGRLPGLRSPPGGLQLGQRGSEGAGLGKAPCPARPRAERIAAAVHGQGTEPGRCPAPGAPRGARHRSGAAEPRGHL